MSNVPKLRFPEFSGEWEEKNLGNLVEIKSGISPSSYDLLDNGKYAFLKVEDLNNCDKYQIISREYSNDCKNIIPQKSIIFPKRGAAILLNKVRININEILMDSNLMAITPNKNIQTEFLYYKIIKDKLFKIADTSTIPQINNKHILPYKVFIPSMPEQEKIASFLTSVDTKIEQFTKKEALLQEYKKGVMQKIFSQEIRFKADDGSDYPEWEEKKLGEIFHFLRGSSLSKSDIAEDGINKCIHYGELFTIYKEKIAQIKSSTNLTDGQFSKIGDILMPSSDVTPQGLATASAIFEENVIVGGDTNILRPKKAIDSLFVSYFLNSNKNEIMKAVTGTTVKHIYNKDVAKLKIYMPIEIKEQTKIANFLSSIDKKIELISQEIKKAKEFKQGLLQQMFV